MILANEIIILTFTDEKMKVLKSRKAEKINLRHRQENSGKEKRRIDFKFKSRKRNGFITMHLITPINLCILLLFSYSFLASTVQATYTPLLPPLPPPDPDETPYMLIRLNDRMDINIFRNDYLAQTKSLTLPGSLPLPEYDVSPEDAIDELPGIDVTSAEIVSARAPFPIGFFFWSSSEENFVSPVIITGESFLPPGRSPSVTTTNDDPALSDNDSDNDDNDDDDGEDTDPDADSPSDQLNRRSFFPTFPPPQSSQFSYVPMSQSPPFYAAERIVFLNYFNIEVLVFVEVLPENTIGSGSTGENVNDDPNASPNLPSSSPGRSRRQRVIPEIRTALFDIELKISFFRSFGPLGNRGSGYSRFQLPQYARNIRRITIVKGPTDGSRCEIEIAGKKFAEFEGPYGDGRQPPGRGRGRGGRRNRGGIGRDINRAPGERSYLKGPMYGATALICYGIFPEGFAD